MKNAITVIFFTLLFTIAGCKMDGPESPPEPIVEPKFFTMLERDTITSGSYLGMEILEKAEKKYEVLQSLRETHDLDYLNVVSNISSDISKLNNRIPLYSYLLLDERKGTDSGVQITIENEKVKAIYLNSGKALNQWPANAKTESSVRIGDAVESIYAKLVNIYNKGTYANKFEYIALQTKNVAASFDPVMAQLPQWYFMRKTGPGLWEEVQVNLKNGVLDNIVVIRYSE